MRVVKFSNNCPILLTEFQIFLLIMIMVIEILLRSNHIVVGISPCHLDLAPEAKGLTVVVVHSKGIFASNNKSGDIPHILSVAKVRMMNVKGRKFIVAVHKVLEFLITLSV
jgi:hypothetical protein